MEPTTFKVKGSATEPYELTFIKDGGSLTALCTCPAGEFGNVCKHRTNILDGKTAAITSGNEGEVATVREWLVGSDVEAALNELRAAEQAGGDLAAARYKTAVVPFCRTPDLLRRTIVVTVCCEVRKYLVLS